MFFDEVLDYVLPDRYDFSLDYRQEYVPCWGMIDDYDKMEIIDYIRRVRL